MYWQVGPIPVKDGIGKETVLVYSTDIQSDKKMYTDANGRQLIERIRRIDSLDAFETSNYYPITSRVELRSNEDVFTVLPDRSEGAASLVDGQLELILHRRLLHDDGYGVGEPLNETETFNGEETGLVVVGQHRVLTGHSLDQARSEMLEHDLPVQLSFLSTQLTLENWVQLSLQEYSGIKKELPANVQILSLSVRNSSTVLLRLYNMMAQDENSEPAYVDLQNLFTEFEIVTMEEENLTGATPLSFSKQHAVHWNINNDNNNNKYDESGFRSVEDISPVELTPLQIRTFILNVVWN
ncbi:lysosomal alpha-mannosidase [Eurytemora carolleeae]|uniref:lysosomal alpha-mannosidase n=1 Tax=Eurytemora carolleeae TaxID=1294199 RepID=UPI000C765265|nr:lysosomal alpha-mannosidase [Eurytemora carolleeae]|eukprot:XP_023330226.1 lysosomal alpha-mannosidase-like [Eurytemora affinis]